jgi:uncharacterized protein YcbK (DUF882 family)
VKHCGRLISRTTATRREAWRKWIICCATFAPGDVHRIDPALLDILFDLQTLANRDAPFEVISGYRSPATNAMLHRSSDSVAQHSMHLEGRAIDVRLSGFATRSLAEHARTLGRGGVGFYARSDFVHVDTGRVRFW